MVEVNLLWRRLSITLNEWTVYISEAARPFLIEMLIWTRAKGSGFWRWLSRLVVFWIWVSLELEVRGWELFQPRMRQNQPPSIWPRLAYHLAFSLVGFQTFLLVLARSPVSWWSLLLCAVHGFVAYFCARRAIRWCKQVLGVRPLRTVDPKNPCGGLDL